MLEKAPFQPEPLVIPQGARRKPRESKVNVIKEEMRFDVEILTGRHGYHRGGRFVHHGGRCVTKFHQRCGSVALKDGRVCTMDAVIVDEGSETGGLFVAEV